MNRELKEARRGGEVIPFEQTPLATAPSPPGDDWLRQLPNECRFVARPVVYKGPWLDAYGIAGVLPECICLAIFRDGAMSLQWVDSLLFSNTNKLIAVLPTQEVQKVPKEEPDG